MTVPGEPRRRTALDDAAWQARRAVVILALRRNRGRHNATARALGILPRHLRRTLDRLAIDVDAVLSGAVTE